MRSDPTLDRLSTDAAFAEGYAAATEDIIVHMTPIRDIPEVRRAIDLAAAMSGRPDIPRPVMD